MAEEQGVSMMDIEKQNAERLMRAFRNELTGEIDRNQAIIIDGWSTANQREFYNWATSKGYIKSEYIEESQYGYYAGSLTEDGYVLLYMLGKDN